MQTIKLHPAFHPFIADGRKTQTRRVIDLSGLGGFADGAYSCKFVYIEEHNIWEMHTNRNGLKDCALIKCPYRIGEIVKWGNGEGRITDIKCERLQDISEEDAIAEGVQRTRGYRDGNHFQIDCDFVPLERWLYYSPVHCAQSCTTANAAFADMWRHIYPDGPESWESNPCVWALTIGEGDE